MKKVILIIIFVFSILFLFSQGISVEQPFDRQHNAPDVQDTCTTYADLTARSTAGKTLGRPVYLLDSARYYYWSGSAWTKLVTAGYWEKTGNYIYELNDSIGIGTNSPAEKLDIDGNIQLSGKIDIDNTSVLVTHSDDTLLTNNKSTLGLGLGLQKSVNFGVGDVAIGSDIFSKTYGGAPYNTSYAGLQNTAIGNRTGSYLSGQSYRSILMGYMAGFGLKQMDTSVVVGSHALSFTVSPGTIYLKRSTIIGAHSFDNLGSGLSGTLEGIISLGERNCQEWYNASSGIFIGNYLMDGAGRANQDSLIMIGNAIGTNITGERNSVILSGYENNDVSKQWIVTNGAFGIGRSYSRTLKPIGLFHICGDLGSGDLDNDTSLVFNEGGYLGIGTPTPAEKLDVVGNINISGFINNNVAAFDYLKQNNNTVLYVHPSILKFGHITNNITLIKNLLLGNYVGERSSINTGNTLAGEGYICYTPIDSTANEITGNTIYGYSSFLPYYGGKYLMKNVCVGSENANKTGNCQYNTLLGNNIYKDSIFERDSILIIHNGVSVGLPSNALMYGEYDGYVLANQKLTINAQLGIPSLAKFYFDGMDGHNFIYEKANDTVVHSIDGQEVIQYTDTDITAKVPLNVGDLMGVKNTNQKLIDMVVDTDASDGTVVGFTTKIDANDIFGVKALSDGANDIDSAYIDFTALTDCDFPLNFIGTSNSGSITYMEDEDRFDFDNDVDVIADLTAGTITSDATIKATTMLGNVAQQTITLGVGVTTFGVTSNVIQVTGDGGANTIATITGAGVGTYTFIFTDANVTITDTPGHAANTIDLSAAFTSADDTVLMLVFDGTSFYEISRSTN